MISFTPFELVLIATVLKLGDSGNIVEFRFGAFELIPLVNGKPIMCSVRFIDLQTFKDPRCYPVTDSHILRGGLNRIIWSRRGLNSIPALHRLTMDVECDFSVRPLLLLESPTQQTVQVGAPTNYNSGLKRFLILAIVTSAIGIVLISHMKRLSR